MNASVATDGNEVDDKDFRIEFRGEPLYEKSVERTKRLVGCSREDAVKIVNSTMRASAKTSLNVIAGSGSTPSTFLGSRADLLKEICMDLERQLTEKEIEIIFRSTPSEAKSILIKMRSIYADDIFDQMKEKVKTGATRTSTGNNKSGLTWTVSFSARDLFDFACELLEANHGEYAIEKSVSKSIYQIITENRESSGKHVLEILGIKMDKSE